MEKAHLILAGALAVIVGKILAAAVAKYAGIAL